MTDAPPEEQVIANPYPGLRPFEPEQALLFFGRDPQITELLQRLSASRLVALVGASGCGKSSLVRAGLLPALDSGALVRPGSRWRIALMRPSHDPVATLAHQLNETLGPDPGRLTNLKASTFGLLHASVAGRGPEEHLLVFIDQFEDLFRLMAEKRLKPEDGAEFVDLLLAVAEEPRPEYRVHVVLTIRSEYIGHCDQFEGLPQALNRSQYLVPRLTPDQLQKAIEYPAARYDTVIEPALLARLLADASTGEDSLPRLQHLLMRLWDVHSGDEVTLDDYHRPEIGGLQHALDLHATQVFESLTASQQAVARRVFQALTQYAEGSRDARRPTGRKRLVNEVQASAEEAQAVVECFREANFLTLLPPGPDGDPEVDITHESLIRHWRLLVKWTTEERRAAEIYRGLARAVRERANPIWTEAELKEALQWRDEFRPTEAWAYRYDPDGLLAPLALLEKLEKQWKERESRKRRQIVGLTVLTAVFLALLIGVGVAYVRLKQAENAVVAQRLAALAESKRVGSVDQLDLSLLLAIEAYKRSPGAETDEQLRKSADLIPLPVALLRHDAPVLDVAFGPEDRYAATRPEGNEVLLWDLASKKVLQSYKHAARVNAFTFSNDRQRIATAAADGEVRIWVTLDSKEPLLRLVHGSPVNAVAFSPDARLLLSGSDDGTVRLWDLGSGRELARAKHEGAVNLVAFSQDGWLAGSAGDDNGVRLWRVPGMQPAGQIRMVEFVTSLAFGNNRLLTADYGGLMRAWSTSDGKLLGGLRSGGWRVSGNLSRALDYTSPSRSGSKVEERTLGFNDAIRGVVWGDWGGVLTLERAGTARTWWVPPYDLSRVQELTRFIQPDPIQAAALDGEGHRTLTSGGRFVRLWERPRRFQGSREVEFEVALGDWRGLPSAVVIDGPTRIARDAFLVYKDLEISLRDRATGKEQTHVALDAPLRGVELSRDGRRFLFWTANGRLQIFAKAREWPAKPERSVQMDAESAVFSPDGSLVALCGDSPTVRIVPVSRSLPERQIDLPSACRSVAFDPEGERLAAGMEHGIAIAKTASGRIQTELSLPVATVSLAFNSGARNLATRGSDGYIRVWDLSNKITVARIPTANLSRPSLYSERPDMAFVKEGRLLLASGVLHYWRPADMIEQACRLTTRTLTPSEVRDYLSVEHYSPACRIAPDLADPAPHQ